MTDCVTDCDYTGCGCNAACKAEPDPIEVGDKVYVNDGGYEGNFYGHGVVTAVLPDGWIVVEGPWGGSLTKFDFAAHRVSKSEPGIRGAVPPAAWYERLPDDGQEPDRHPNSARFHELLAEAGAMHDKKQADYGKGDDPFYNIRASEDWGVDGWVGSLIRLSDKVNRLKSLRTKGYLANEAVEDSFMDIAVYALIAYVLYEQAAAEA